MKKHLICKGTKKEMLKLKELAEIEIREWQSFLKEINKRLKIKENYQPNRT